MRVVGMSVNYVLGVCGAMCSLVFLFPSLFLHRPLLRSSPCRAVLLCESSRGFDEIDDRGCVCRLPDQGCEFPVACVLPSK
jgi:hypothetical protein